MNTGKTIKEMYRDERPYEKCEQYGAENLTDGEYVFCHDGTPQLDEGEK